MEKEVEESIKKFEHKKEFREVKLKTRESFREDQVALERRLSSFREGARRKMSADEKSGGSDDKGRESEPDELSKLESIVLDISKEREEESVVLEMAAVNVELKPETNGISDHKDPVDTKVNGHSTRVYGTPVYENIPSPVYENTSMPNGGYLGSAKTRSNGHIPASMTPEPRMKASGRRIYEKNPKLTSASTEHLDTISQKGAKQTNPNYGMRLVDMKPQQTFVPIVPSLPIAAIPPDGNLRDFNVDEMITIFRMLNVNEELLLRFSANKVDGKRFAMFTDKDLETLGISNPIVRYFRDRTTHRRKKRPVFML